MWREPRQPWEGYLRSVDGNAGKLLNNDLPQAEWRATISISIIGSFRGAKAMMQGSRYFDPPPEDEEIRLLSLHDSQLRAPQFRSLGLTQIPKFGIVLVLVVGALECRDRKETDVLQLICSVSLIAKRSGFSRTRTTTSTIPQFRSLGLTSRAAVSEGSSLCPVLLCP